MFAHTAHGGNELSDCDRAVALRVAAMARKEKRMVDVGCTRDSGKWRGTGKYKNGQRRSHVAGRSTRLGHRGTFR